MEAKHKQAFKIIQKFGGAPMFCRTLNRNGHDIQLATIYRWTYAADKGGTDGIIPSKWVEPIQATAMMEGVELTDADWAP